MTNAHTHTLKCSLGLESWCVFFFVCLFFFFFAARGLPCGAQGFSSCSAQISSILVHGLL